jgi:hypothetical protein
MKRRPLSNTNTGLVFIGMCSVGLVYHLLPLFKGGAGEQHLPEQGLFWISSIRLAGLIGGLFLLRGSNWARWLLLAWMAFHVVVSLLHSVAEVIVHGVFLAVLLFLLFRPSASAYFKSCSAKTVSTPESEEKPIA